MTTLVSLNRKKGSLKAQITRLETSINDQGLEWTKTKLELKVKSLEKLVQSLETLKIEFYEILPENDDLSDLEAEFLDMQERMEMLEVSLTQLLKDFEKNCINKIENKDNSNVCNIKLPEITLPQFSGRYEDWNPFKIEFDNLITNNKQLNDVQKLRYLNSALKNEAKLLQTPEDSFQSLFDALKNRFENKRILVNIHIKAILEFEKIVHESSKELRRLVDIIHKNIRALNNLGFERNEFSDALISIVILEKLDKDTRKQFELSINSSEVIKLDDLIAFLEKRSQSLESINKNTNVKSKSNVEQKPKSLFIKSNNPDRNCVVCNMNHPLYKCSKFLEMNFPARFNVIKRYNLCLLCFSKNHMLSQCKSHYFCSICQSKHNTLLHKPDNTSILSNMSENSTRSQTPVGRAEKLALPSDGSCKNSQVEEKPFANCLFISNKSVILPSAKIMIQTGAGKFIEGTTLIDSCSMINCVTADFAKQLRLKKIKTFAPVSGINGIDVTLNQKIKTLIANKEKSFVKELEFLIIPKITETTSFKSLSEEKLEIPKNIVLADVNFNKPQKIDLLLGAECFFDLLKSGQVRCLPHDLILQETVFGYVVSGVIQNPSPDPNYCALLTQIDNIEETMRKFWEIENINDSETPLSNEELYCENHFKENYYRTSEGQYGVCMPMDDSTLLGESKQLAEKRLSQIWKRLSRDSNLQLLYSEFMQEYKSLDHMEIVKKSEIENVSYYLPHHGVYRPDKSSTRLRVVFNASSPTSSGLSLNDILLKGKIPQQELFSIMLRFRTHRYAFTADIEKMYRMILIHPSQRDLLRILWKENINSPVQICRLKTITYGTANAPYLATRTLRQLALDEHENLPLASSVALTDFYIDDILSGESSLEKTKLLQAQLIELLNRGKMTLHKWHSNHPELLGSENKISTQYHFNEQKELNSVKALGVLWDTQNDCFLYQIKIPEKEVYSKRDVLSLISRHYDPLGLIGPVITRAKIFMQRLWSAKLEWDDPLPDAMNKDWLCFISSLTELENLRIPRFIFYENRIIVHGFADAAMSAYGAVIYVQNLPQIGSPTARLLCSKSRVSPLKTLSVPRLELCACLLLAKLVKKVLPSLNAEIETVVLWSDSMIALAWIEKSPHLLKTFVGNRVSLIQELSGTLKWLHVPSKSNPADVISRGLDAKDIISCDLWWYGGPKLIQDEIQPVEHQLEPCDYADFEKELKQPSNSNFAVFETNTFVNHLLNLTNDYMKLIKILSFIIRFLHNIRHTRDKWSGKLSVEELKNSELNIIRLAQKGEFFSDILSLRENGQINHRSHLRSLNPFLDKNGILRVGSRIAYSGVSYNSKFPIILPAKHRLTQLIMSYYHLKYFHLGPQALLNTVRQMFWPISGRSLARKIVHQCVQCFKHRPILTEQLMGNLPVERVRIEPPFNKCGLDFCGPFLIKSKNQRKGSFQKIYVAVFVCFVTRAVHLEIVSDLSSEALIATLKRFIARRGKCSTIFSDNASNFTGARTELKRLFKLALIPEKELVDYLLSEEIEWRFIPPRAPHFGGLWEAGVKSFKTHLKKTIGNSKLTIEEFLTLVTQIEAVLNSRPITPLSSDSSDFNPLTPGHFLIGRPLTAPLEPDITIKPDNRLSRWERVTKMTQNIWKRWQRDYLSQLHERTKWQFEKNNIKIGTVVLLKEDNLPVCHWVLGRIEEVIPGRDGKIRVVKVRTAKGLFKRPISRLSILPIKDNFDQ